MKVSVLQEINTELYFSKFRFSKQKYVAPHIFLLLAATAPHRVGTSYIVLHCIWLPSDETVVGVIAVCIIAYVLWSLRNKETEIFCIMYMYIIIIQTFSLR
jgi:hypothetical protein